MNEKEISQTKKVIQIIVLEEILKPIWGIIYLWIAFLLVLIVMEENDPYSADPYVDYLYSFSPTLMILALGSIIIRIRIIIINKSIARSID